MRISDWSSDVCSSDLMDALLIEQLQARRTVAELRLGQQRIATELAQRKPLGVLATVPQFVAAGRSHHLECRVGNILADLAADRDLGAAIDLNILEFLPVLRRDRKSVV